MGMFNSARLEDRHLFVNIYIFICFILFKKNKNLTIYGKKFVDD